MAFKYITSKDSPNYGYPDGRRGQNKPKEIIIHHWGSPGQKFDNVVNWLCNPNAGVSAHLVVEGGKAACIVNFSDAAWHAGNRAVNMSSIGIECRPEMSNSDFDTVAQVIAMVWKEYGKQLPLRGHKQIVPTACPGLWYPKLKELYNLATKYYKGTAGSVAGTIATKPTTNKTFKVKVDIPDLYIRAGAGTNTAKRGFIKKGVYTIVETKKNGGYTWGKLKSGAGWIALDFVKKL